MTRFRSRLLSAALARVGTGALACAIAIPLSSALFLSGCKPRAASPANAAPEASRLSVQYIVAQPLDPERARPGSTFLGLLRCDTEALLAFKVPGQIVAIGPEGAGEDWREGTPVEKGAVLARLDPADYVNLVNAARSRAAFTRAAYARYAELFAAASISKNDFDASRSQKETAEADLARAEQNLTDTVLRAPYSGVLLSRYAKTGEVSAAGKPVLRLGDFRRVSIDVGVPETLLGSIVVGQSYPVRLTAFPDAKHLATVHEIGAAAAEGSRLFRVVLKVSNPEGRLKPGMTASVRFGQPPSHPDGSVIVPLSALFSSPGKNGASGGGATSEGAAPDRARGDVSKGKPAAVYVVDAGTARLRSIVTGDFVGSSIVVTGGLRAGDRVVTVGAAQLHDGAPVTATPAAASAP